VRGIGAALRHAARLDQTHDLLAAREGGDRVAVAHGLREGAEVRLDPVELLHATACHPEAGLHLVEDQHHAVLVAQRAGRLQVVHLRGDAAGVAQDRLDQHGADLVAVLAQRRVERVEVVQRDVVDVLLEHGRDALALRGVLGLAVAVLHVLHLRLPEHAVRQAVEAALDHDVVALARVASRQAQGRHHHLGARAGEAHQLGDAHHLGDALGDGELPLGGEGHDAAHLDALAGGGVDLRMGVAQDGGPVAQPVVDVLVVVDVPEPGAPAPGGVDGELLAPAAEVRGHPGGQAADGVLVVEIRSAQ
jgi:hypothetical protein